MTTENKTTYAADDLDAIRNRLAETSGPEYWRSLEEVAQTDTFKSYIQNEFHMDADPGQALGAVSRRNFLQVMGASLALAGVTAGCSRQPDETIHPYVRQPEEFVPGRPTYFASTHVNGGYAQGVLVESHMGRPTKIEGLPGHPATRGRTDVQTQASVLDMYDPDRTKTVTRGGAVDSWDRLVATLNARLDSARPQGGEGVRILTGATTSPLEIAKLEQFKKAYPNATVHTYEPFGRDNEHAGAQMAFGRQLDTILHLDKADIVVSLDADIFEQGPARTRYMADLAARRKVDSFDEPYKAKDHHGDHGDEGDHGDDHADESHDDHGDESHEEFHPKLNRIYAFESSPTLLGAMADHRFPFRPSQIESVARALADALGVNNALPGGDSDLTEQQLSWIAAVAKDLESKKGHSVVAVGSTQTPAVHALAHAINAALGNIGETVSHIAPVEYNAGNHLASLKALTDDMNAGKVNTLIIAGDVNPVYTAPADLEFAAALAKVSTRARLSRYFDETAKLCEWHAPELHYLETWGDAKAFEGTVSLIQPLIAPLYFGKTRTELLSALVDEVEKSAHDMLKEHWQAAWNQSEDNGAFDRKWRTTLSTGIVDDSASRPIRARITASGFGDVVAPAQPDENSFEVIFAADPSVGDGTYSNNAWLQEVPKPLTKVTWDNAVYMGYSTAQSLGLKDEMEVEVSLNGRSVKGAVCIQPGHASNAITLHAGFGRWSMGKVCEVSEGYLGFNAYALRTSDHTFANYATVRRTNNTYLLARTEEHHNMEGRGLVRHITEEKYTAHPSWVLYGENHEFHVPKYEETMMDPDEKNEWNHEGKNRHAWAMTIDLNQCTGCNACIIACQSENIIPVVGKDEVRRGREMQWIRLDRYYYTGREKSMPSFLEPDNPETLQEKSEAELTAHYDNPTTYFQPVPCMQCENALCEVVCPVGATMHSREGLNDMVYNRCIGTRFCSNNCPYKVRRFNFFNFTRTPLGSRGDRGHSSEGVSMKFETTHVYPESMKLMRNPDVTVRTRGVMEKCTYCVQRINKARIDAKVSDGKVADGTVSTACEQACPAGAITFGDMLDESSRVARNRASARNYQILADLNTKPRTTYLAKVTNPNPELEA